MYIKWGESRNGKGQYHIEYIRNKYFTLLEIYLVRINYTVFILYIRILQLNLTLYIVYNFYIILHIKFHISYIKIICLFLLIYF